MSTEELRNLATGLDLSREQDRNVFRDRVARASREIADDYIMADSRMSPEARVADRAVD